MENFRKEFRPSGSVVVALLITVLWVPRTTFAASRLIVGAGTAASCTEWALQDALFAASLNGGGVIRFDCGPSPVTITTTATTLLPDGTMAALLPPHRTTIDGGDLITLRRSEVFGSLMAVAPDSIVTLKRLIIQGMPVSPDSLPFGTRPVPNVVNRGRLVLQSVSLTLGGDGTSIAPVSIDNRGWLEMRNSTVSGIRGTFLSSAPIQNFATATINNSTFVNNAHNAYTVRGIDDGGAIFNTGRLVVNRSVFSDNSVFTDGGGGAIANHGGTLIVRGSDFTRNSAHYGGAIENILGGSVTVTNSLFDSNRGFEGGALLGGFDNADSSPSSALVSRSTFVRNHGTWGGAIEQFAGTIRVEHSTISENVASQGGGVTGAQAELTFVNSEISSNWADFGGGFYSQSDDAITLVNSKLTSNEAEFFGGGIYLSPTSSLTLVRTTVADNTPEHVWPTQ